MAGSWGRRPNSSGGSSGGRRPQCSWEMLCDLVCFVVLGIVACSFLKYLIASIVEEDFYDD